MLCTHIKSCPTTVFQPDIYNRSLCVMNRGKSIDHARIGSLLSEYRHEDMCRALTQCIGITQHDPEAATLPRSSPNGPKVKLHAGRSSGWSYREVTSTCRPHMAMLIEGWIEYHEWIYAQHAAQHTDTGSRAPVHCSLPSRWTRQPGVVDGG